MAAIHTTCGIKGVVQHERRLREVTCGRRAGHNPPHVSIVVAKPFNKWLSWSDEEAK